MDLKVENGDIAVNEQGYPLRVYGTDEAWQRAALVLSINKGTYMYDRELGADWSCLSPEPTDEEVLLLCREALADHEEIYIESASARRTGRHILLTFTVRDGENFKTGEVNIDAQL